jgi:transcriptional regulator with XRE-family HTH domain
MVKISKEETGKKIRRLLAESGITVRDVQEELELDSPQSVYKWLKGKTLPSLDNLLILGSMLDLPVEQLLVLEGEEDAEIIERRKRWVKKRPRILCAYVLRTHKNLERIQMILGDTRTDWKPERHRGIWKEAPEPENGGKEFH